MHLRQNATATCMCSAFVLPTSVLNEKLPNQKSIAFSALQKLNPVKTDYAGLGAVIETIKL